MSYFNSDSLEDICGERPKDGWGLFIGDFLGKAMLEVFVEFKVCPTIFNQYMC